MTITTDKARALIGHGVPGKVSKRRRGKGRKGRAKSGMIPLASRERS